MNKRKLFIDYHKNRYNKLKKQNNNKNRYNKLEKQNENLFLSYLFEFLTFKCRSCERHSLSIKIRGQNTSYVDDIENYTFECKDCHELHESYWEERWAEYYSSI